jgi:predicted DNA-binding transcriptional regulator AlpA
MESDERLTMTLPEFAKASGCSRGLIYALAKRNQLPVEVIRLGRRMVLSRAKVEALYSQATAGQEKAGS